MKKAYGFVTHDHWGNSDVAGICVDEDGKVLGNHISSSLSWLEKDLSRKAVGYDYSFSIDPPDFLLKEQPQNSSEG